MARTARPDAKQVIARLAGIKSLIAQMKDAMPRHAAELRREACEDLTDLMAELA